MDKIRILQIVPNMQAGGLESLIMNIYRNIDRNKVQFDFLVHYSERKHFDDEIESLGGKIYRLPLRDNNNIIKYIVQLNRFYKEHSEYKVIHCHMSSIGFINFLVAKRNGIKVRIAHSHNSATDGSVKGKIKRLMMLPYKYVTTKNYACSTEAGKYLYGKKEFEIIPNSIDVKKYIFSKEKREEIRKKYNIPNDAIVLGHIGRFNVQKNHAFLIEVFKNLVDNSNKNYYLLLVGDGELKSKIEELVNQYNIEDKVIFTGVVSDTWNYYSCMDAFLLPSLFEGLPVVGVEAQANGLSVLLADNITREVEINDNVYYIKNNISEWVENVEKMQIKKFEERFECNKNVLNTNFNISFLAKKLEKEYEELYYEKV